MHKKYIHGGSAEKFLVQATYQYAKSDVLEGLLGYVLETGQLS